jgi:hypothetical protein
MELLFILIVGIAIGWYWHAWVMVQRMIDNPDGFIDVAKKIKKIDSDVKDRLEDLKPKAIRTEFLQGQCYVYDGETFLAQGETLHEALTNAEKRFPGQYNFTLRLTKPNESNQSS